mgnify:CR=1 FL=1
MIRMPCAPLPHLLPCSTGTTHVKELINALTELAMWNTRIDSTCRMHCLTYDCMVAHIKSKYMYVQHSFNMDHGVVSICYIYTYIYNRSQIKVITLHLSILLTAWNITKMHCFLCCNGKTLENVSYNYLQLITINITITCIV